MAEGHVESSVGEGQALGQRLAQAAAHPARAVEPQRGRVAIDLAYQAAAGGGKFRGQGARAATDVQQSMGTGGARLIQEPAADAARPSGLLAIASIPEAQVVWRFVPRENGSVQGAGPSRPPLGALRLPGAGPDLIPRVTQHVAQDAGGALRGKDIAIRLDIQPGAAGAPQRHLDFGG